ncbi:MAG TPA: hypothetical protein VH020_15925 [Stellaceae bacterium]|jgi:alkanesulfonate monooxygenase SsuD/methylene tetrahydromethanopterin reductase-like flavin-dependent oxidoreductase (luciferase family)|nr:hypothetical protein [Stellaceae bacterium]
MSRTAIGRSIPTGATYDELVRDGIAIAGTPDKVVKAIERQAAALGINYLVTYLFLGGMALPEALRSLQLFATEAMPRLGAL